MWKIAPRDESNEGKLIWIVLIKACTYMQFLRNQLSHNALCLIVTIYERKRLQVWFPSNICSVPEPFEHSRTMHNSWFSYQYFLMHHGQFIINANVLSITLESEYEMSIFIKSQFNSWLMYEYNCCSMYQILLYLYNEHVLYGRCTGCL